MGSNPEPALLTIGDNPSEWIASGLLATHRQRKRRTRVRASEIGSQDAGFTRPSGDVPFQEGTKFPRFFWQFPSSVANLLELQGYDRVNEFAHRHLAVAARR